ncbi:hypothetical protein [Gracilibacillus saliphilus]|uniref:hypothetical protein n=1 Tax=Gracilibacillus saliphilus TaxID=543890 RepID=UPI0013D78F29|nr:hypothetical protein [Gracilibacillus saliphilus]
MTLTSILLRFFLLLTIPVLSIFYAGLIVAVFLSISGGVLRTLGFDQIQMGIWPGIELPVALSIPFALGVSLLLIIGAFYTRRFIRKSLRMLRMNRLD